VLVTAVLVVSELSVSTSMPLLDPRPA
jgi:hypothetical protein